MKDISLSTNDTPFVERLKKIIAALFKFLDWFTPAHPFIAEKRARTFLVSFTMLFFELLCIRWIPSYVRYLSYFNNFLLLASFLGIGLGMLSARRQRFWFPPFPVLLPPLVWFSILSAHLLLLSAKHTVLFAAVVLAATLIEVGRLQVGAYWSPYYKIILRPAVPSGYNVDVNGTGHQSMIPWQYRDKF